jgi:6-pyruvoyltetrahydropterin/6-carboxytetrahydropterin synthase
VSGPTVDLLCRSHFSAAHRLWCEELDEAQNRALYGPCVGEHGHDFQLEVAVRGTVDPRTGLLIDLAQLQATVRQRVFEPCDHRHLNRDVPFLRGTIPTVENVALALWRELEAGLDGRCRLVRLRLWEGPHCAVELQAVELQAGAGS